jgi:hypothetical protein
MKKQTYRVKSLEVSAQVISDIGKKARINQLPKDAETLRVAYDPIRNIFKIFIYSKHFPVVPEGSVPPELEPPVIGEEIFKQ